MGINRLQELQVYKGDGPFIFISYSHLDGDNDEKVFSIINRMQIDGYHVWFDKGIEAGVDWTKDITEHIKKAACMVVFLSKNHLNSDNCKDEIHFAKTKKIPTLIIYLEDIEVPDEFEMSYGRMQAIKCSQYANEDSLFERIYEAKMLEACKEAATAATENVCFKISLRADGGSLFIYSPDCFRKEDEIRTNITEEIWNAFVERCKDIIVEVMPGAKKEFIRIQRQSNLGEYLCAPMDGHLYFDSEYRIDFAVSFLRDKRSENYDSFRFDIIKNASASVSLFKKGNYAFKYVPEDADLAFFGINEDLLWNAVYKMIQFATGNEDVCAEGAFTKKVYNDGSGGFYLNFLN